MATSNGVTEGNSKTFGDLKLGLAPFSSSCLTIFKFLDRLWKTPFPVVKACVIDPSLSESVWVAEKINFSANSNLPSFIALFKGVRWPPIRPRRSGMWAKNTSTSSGATGAGGGGILSTWKKIGNSHSFNVELGISNIIVGNWYKTSMMPEPAGQGGHLPP